MWLLKRSGRIRQEDPNRQSVEDATPTTSFGTPRAASRQHEESASAHGGLLGMAKNHMLYSRAFEALQPLGNEFKEAMESDDGPDASFVQKYRYVSTFWYASVLSSYTDPFCFVSLVRFSSESLVKQRVLFWKASKPTRGNFLRNWVRFPMNKLCSPPTETLARSSLTWKLDS